MLALTNGQSVAAVWICETVCVVGGVYTTPGAEKICIAEGVKRH